MSFVFAVKSRPSAAEDLTWKDKLAPLPCRDKFVVPTSVCFRLDRIPAGGTARVEFTVIPLKTGAGVTSPAKITYKAEEDASKLQVHAQSSTCWWMAISFTEAAAVQFRNA